MHLAYDMIAVNEGGITIARNVNKGRQDFESLVAGNNFYKDKTGFIREWWDKDTDITLITRPRRFGKTLNLSMIERFFSVQYKGMPEPFIHLDVGSDAGMMKHQGEFPVISLTLAGITDPTYEEMIKSLSAEIRELFEKVSNRLGLEGMNSRDVTYIERLLDERYDECNEIIPLSEIAMKGCLKRLSSILSNKYNNKKVIILLDEYDAPLENAYLHGYREKAAEFFGQFYKNTFKVNSYLGRALITGINVLPKESLNSPFNNIDPCSVTSSSYGWAFGFTQKEVDDTLEEYELTDKRDVVKWWYDGYQFGEIGDMYNPWSISLLIASGKFKAYWANSASNEIVSHVIRYGTKDLKDQFVVLMQGGAVEGKINETLTYKLLHSSRETVFGLLLASGYLKGEEVGNEMYKLSIMNHEVREMMDGLIENWFKTDYDDVTYVNFINALIKCDEKEMQNHLSTLSVELMSYFDVAKKENEKESENFYHGFVLGLVASLRKKYVITSNRESGEGRYDIMLEPIDKMGNNGIIIEFKVFNPKEEKNLEGTSQRALNQIRKMKYDVELKKHGIPKEHIYSFGIGYKGKAVRVKKGV